MFRCWNRQTSTSRGNIIFWTESHWFSTSIVSHPKVSNINQGIFFSTFGLRSILFQKPMRVPARATSAVPWLSRYLFGLTRWWFGSCGFVQVFLATALVYNPSFWTLPHIGSRSTWIHAHPNSCRYTGWKLEEKTVFICNDHPPFLKHWIITYLAISKILHPTIFSMDV